MAIYQNIDTPFDFRLGALEALDTKGINRSELARRVQARVTADGKQVCERQTVLRFLRGDSKPSSEVLSHIMAELEMIVLLPKD